MPGAFRDQKQRRSAQAVIVPLLVTIWIASAVSIVGCGHRLEIGAEAEESYPVFAREEGRRLFDSYCQSCHGEFGWGDGRFYASSLDPPPPDFTESQFMESRTDEDIIQAITEGTLAIGKSDLCPAWGKTFRTEEIGYLLTHIRWLQSQVGAEAQDMLQ